MLGDWKTSKWISFWIQAIYQSYMRENTFWFVFHWKCLLRPMERNKSSGKNYSKRKWKWNKWKREHWKIAFMWSTWVSIFFHFGVYCSNMKYIASTPISGYWTFFFFDYLSTFAHSGFSPIPHKPVQCEYTHIFILCNWM